MARETKNPPKGRPKKKPKGSGWRPRCPECNGSQFSVFPRVTPELSVEYLDNGDVIWKLEDHDTNDDDELVCSNCGRETTWAECDHRRGG